MIDFACLHIIFSIFLRYFMLYMYCVFNKSHALLATIKYILTLSQLKLIKHIYLFTKSVNKFTHIHLIPALRLLHRWVTLSDR